MKPKWPSIAALAGLACICAAVLFFVRAHARHSLSPALKVRAIARQWWWEFDYPSFGVRTSDVLYLPSATDVQLELVSGDVIHSFWIAGMKKAVDIIPGKARRLDLFVKSPGQLYGNCDSGCGCATVCMRFRVFASAPLEFQRWALHKRLRISEFKVPHTGGTPPCVLNRGRDGHVEPNSPATRLQLLLDKGSTA
jgi:heme/copper-type cytochrome/quinol oxidase subunit 2